MLPSYRAEGVGCPRSPMAEGPRLSFAAPLPLVKGGTIPISIPQAAPHPHAREGGKCVRNQKLSGTRGVARFVGDPGCPRVGSGRKEEGWFLSVMARWWFA